MFTSNKYKNSSNAFFQGLIDGVVKMKQSEGSSPRAPEMSFLYELGVRDFLNNIVDLLSSVNLPSDDAGVALAIIDDFHRAAPFESAVKKDI